MRFHDTRFFTGTVSCDLYSIHFRSNQHLKQIPATGKNELLVKVRVLSPNALGPVVRKPINVNPRLKINGSFSARSLKLFFNSNFKEKSTSKLRDKNLFEKSLLLCN